MVSLSPFQIVNDNVTTLAWNDTGDAYIIYSSHIEGYNPNHLMSVEKLSDDYLSSLGKQFNSGFFGQSDVEAPAMFKRNGVYYAVFGSCCCNCQEGSGVTVYQTKNYLGNEGHAQQFNILKYRTSGAEGYGYLWQSAPDGIKAHDFTYWTPMYFVQDGNVQYMNYTANYTIDIISNIY